LVSVLAIRTRLSRAEGERCKGESRIEPRWSDDGSRNPERVYAIASLRKTSRRGAARLAVEPFVFSRANAGFDLLLAIDVVFAAAPFQLKVSTIQWKGSYRSFGSRLEPPGRSSCREERRCVNGLGSIVINRRDIVERHVMGAIYVLGRNPLTDRLSSDDGIAKQS